MSTNIQKFTEQEQDAAMSQAIDRMNGVPDICAPDSTENILIKILASLRNIEKHINEPERVLF